MSGSIEIQRTCPASRTGFAVLVFVSFSIYIFLFVKSSLYLLADPQLMRSHTYAQIALHLDLNEKSGCSTIAPNS